MVKGNLDTVKNTIKIAAKGCHVEITTLIVPGENDRVEEIKELSKWISDISLIFPFIYHDFFQDGRCRTNATPIETVYHLAEIARKI